LLSTSAPPTDTTPFFSRPRNVVLVAILCCLLWGSACSSIKDGDALAGLS
jgi:hypothetical protein